jgi:hypothetical protein
MQNRFVIQNEENINFRGGGEKKVLKRIYRPSSVEKDEFCIF